MHADLPASAAATPAAGAGDLGADPTAPSRALAACFASPAPALLVHLAARFGADVPLAAGLAAGSALLSAVSGRGADAGAGAGAGADARAHTHTHARARTHTHKHTHARWHSRGADWPAVHTRIHGAFVARRCSRRWCCCLRPRSRPRSRPARRSRSPPGGSGSASPSAATGERCAGVWAVCLCVCVCVCVLVCVCTCVRLHMYVHEYA